MVFSHQPESELAKTPLYCSTHYIVSGIFCSQLSVWGKHRVFAVAVPLPSIVSAAWQDLRFTEYMNFKNCMYAVWNQIEMINTGPLNENL